MSILVLPNPLKKSQSPPSDLYSIKVTPNIPEAGTVLGGGMASKGSLMALKSTYNSGYAFEGWKENGSILSRDPNYIFPVERDQDIEASFLESPVLRLGVSWKGGEFVSNDIGTNGRTAGKRIAYGNGWFVVIPVGVSTTSASITRTMDGKQWVKSVSTSSSYVPYPIDIAYGNGTFVIITTSDKWYRSANDGATWNGFAVPGTARNWKYLTYANGMFVALTSSGNYAAYSSDGISWNSVSMPVSGSWTGLYYYSGCFFTHNVIDHRFYYSETGETWKTSPTTTTFEGDVKSGSIILNDIFHFVCNRVANGTRRYYRTRSSVPPSSANFQIQDDILYSGDLAYKDYAITTGCNDDEGKIGIMLMTNSPTYYTLDGAQTGWKVGSMPYSASWTHVVYGNGMFLAVSSSEHYAISYTGNE